VKTNVLSLFGSDATMRNHADWRSKESEYDYMYYETERQEVGLQTVSTTSHFTD